jgi:very-long-chain enoyl-CoA reductase
LISSTNINEAAKKPIKKLPSSIEITDKTTVQDVKNNLARRAGGWNPERFGLFDPEKKKILKDRKALIIMQKEVMKGGEILVKDLGTASLSTSSSNCSLVHRTTTFLDHSLHYRIHRPYPYPPLLRVPHPP